MDVVTITLSSWLSWRSAGGGYALRGAAGHDHGLTPVHPGPGPRLTLLGIVGLILIVAFVVLLATGWRSDWKCNRRRDHRATRGQPRSGWTWTEYPRAGFYLRDAMSITNRYRTSPFASRS